MEQQHCLKCRRMKSSNYFPNCDICDIKYTDYTDDDVDAICNDCVQDYQGEVEYKNKTYKICNHCCDLYETNQKKFIKQHVIPRMKKMKSIKQSKEERVVDIKY